MTIEASGRLAVDGRVEHPAPRRCRLTREHEQPGGVVSDPAAHIGERLQVLIAGQLPERPLSFRVDAAAELAERGVGVHGDHPVVLPQLREHRSDDGRHRGLAGASLAHHTDLEVAA